MRLADITEGH